MTVKVQILLGVFLAIALIVILNMVRKRGLELKYALTWILCDVALLILLLIPNSMIHLAEMLGIYSPMNMIFFLGFIFCIVVIFSLTVALSRVTARVRELAQEIALKNYKDKKKIEEFERKSENEIEK